MDSMRLKNIHNTISQKIRIIWTNKLFVDISSLSAYTVYINKYPHRISKPNCMITVHIYI